MNNDLGKSLNSIITIKLLRLILKLTFVFGGIISLAGCKKEEAKPIVKPVISTMAVSDIMPPSATSGGNISSDGGAPVTARGVVWGTSTGPTVALASKTTNGSGTGNFTSSLTGLSPGVKYYVRAYATNSVGTAYGNEVELLAVSPFATLDNTILNKLSQYNIPGLSLAIVKNEKLVYVQSYGYSDKEANRKASNDDLYRIASISKPITVIAILKLVEEGLISLDQKVFGSGGILGNEYGSTPVGSNKDLITVKHLLDHKSGWTNTPYDPMFGNINNTQTQIISDLLTNRPLTYTPGSNYYYSNVGYCILGRVIEKVKGMSYENYVKSNLLQPCGITEMRVGGNTLSERYVKEVKYYQSEFSPYIMNIRRMDSHGGWIASSTDLARFLVKIDRNGSKADIVSSNSLNQFYFGYTSWAHFGSLPGTSTIMNRLDNTFGFIVLVNTRTESNGNLILNDLNSTLTGQIRSISSWPTHDLF